MSKHLTDEEQTYLYLLLRHNNLVGQIWPVDRSDNSEPIFGMIVSEDAAYQLLKEVADIEFTQRQLSTVLQKFKVVPYDSRFEPAPSLQHTVRKHLAALAT